CASKHWGMGLTCPLPLPSDASGTGSEDYGSVTGRATAIVIDPNDPTGNTVFVGGAYSGVWKSSNAGPLSADPAAVTWTPLTDDSVSVGSASVTSVAYNAAAGMFYAAARFHGFYSSSDGIHWTRLAAQPGAGLIASACPPQAVVPSGCAIFRGQTAIVPNR